MKKYLNKAVAIVVSILMACVQMTPMMQNTVYADEGVVITRDQIESLSSKTQGPAGDGDNIEDSFDGVVDRKFTSTNWMKGENSNEYYVTLKEIVKLNKVRIHPRLNWNRDKVEKCEVFVKVNEEDEWTLAGSGTFSPAAPTNTWLDPIEFEAVYAKDIKIYIESSSGCVSTGEVELYREEGDFGDADTTKPKVNISGEKLKDVYLSIDKITLTDNRELASVTLNEKETAITGTTFEITSDLLEEYGLVDGKNTLVVTDAGGNATTVTFTLKLDHSDLVAQDIIDSYQPVINEGDEKLVLPEYEGYTIEIYGSDNEQVIATDGTIIRPLNDMEVNIMLKATKNDNPELSVISNGNKFVTVKGLYDNTGRNEKPVVEPALREWYGAESGNFVFSDDAQVLLDRAYETELAPMQEILATDFTEIVGRNVNVEFGDASDVQTGDVFITLSGETSLGEEGNLIEIDDSITIKACAYTGAFWGTRSVLQIMKLNGNTVPKGTARDYPRYATRGFMFDVARKYAPMSYLYDIMRTMSWYKMNSLQIHLSDDKGERRDAFRLENETYPGLTADDGYYTKDEFRQFTKDSLKNGITIIPEFDVPGHSTCFVRIRPDLKNPGVGSELDVTNPNTLPFVKTIFDEYLDGEDPVFVNDMVHFGADEFTGDSMGYINFLDAMIEYMESKGKHGAFWNSFGDHPVPADFDIASNATGYVWYPGGNNSAHGLLDQGMTYINVDSTQLYIVPCDDGSTGTYRDFIRNENIYNTWKVSNHDNIPSAHPGQLGSMFACWQDHAGSIRYTNYEIFDMWFPSISVIAQRTWSQENQLNYAEFKKTSETLGCGPDVVFDDVHPEANEDNVVLNYDFENGEAKDMSGNNNDGTFTENGVTIENDPEQGNVVRFDGTGNIETNLKAIKWPYTLSLDIKADADNALGATIFSSPKDTRFNDLPEDYKYDFLDGALLLKQGKDGNLGYAREMAVVVDGSGHPNPYYLDRNAFDFGTALEPGEWHNITMTAERHEIILYIDGVEASRMVIGKHPIFTSFNTDMSFVLPLKLIGKEFKGEMDNITVYNDIVKPTVPAVKHNITIDSDITNGTVSTDTNKAAEGSTVTITATPNENYQLKADSIKVYKTDDMTTEVAVTNNAFVMPAFDVTITAEFELMLADYSKVDEAIAKVPADLTVYTEESQAALQTALDAVVRDLDASKQAEVDAMAEAINAAIDNLEKAIYTITVNGEVAATGAYNEKVTITAPASDQTFTGWMLNGKVVSTQSEYTFFISEDMEFTPCYEEVTLAPEVMLTNTILTRRDTKADVKFVAQLVLPKGYTLVNAGLVWSSQEDTALDLTNAKTTYITRISNTDQFSVTIKGMPAGRFIRGRIFATVVDDEGNETVIYSDEARVVNK